MVAPEKHKKKEDTCWARCLLRLCFDDAVLVRAEALSAAEKAVSLGCLRGNEGVSAWILEALKDESLERCTERFEGVSIGVEILRRGWSWCEFLFCGGCWRVSLRRLCGTVFWCVWGVHSECSCRMEGEVYDADGIWNVHPWWFSIGFPAVFVFLSVECESQMVQSAVRSFCFREIAEIVSP